MLSKSNFKIFYQPGSRGGKPDSLSRRPEYRPEEGARHTKQSTLKTEHFQISVIHQKQSAERALTGERREPTSLRIMKLSDKAIGPTKGSRFAASHDIYALTNGVVPAKGQIMVQTGIMIGLQEGTYGRLAARSGMASKMGIAVGPGVIDADYTGEVKVIVQNHGEADCVFKGGDRIVQLIIEKIQVGKADAMGVDNLEATKRGEWGFGSSDLNPRDRLVLKKKESKYVSFTETQTITNSLAQPISAITLG